MHSRCVPAAAAAQYHHQNPSLLPFLPRFQPVQGCSHPRERGFFCLCCLWLETPSHIKMAGAGALQFVLAFFEVRERLFFSASPAIGCSFRILSLQRAAAAWFGSQRGAAGLSQPFLAARHLRAGSMARGATAKGDEWYWGPWAGAARVGATVCGELRTWEETEPRRRCVERSHYVGRRALPARRRPSRPPPRARAQIGMAIAIIVLVANPLWAQIPYALGTCYQNWWVELRARRGRRSKPAAAAAAGRRAPAPPLIP